MSVRIAHLSDIHFGGEDTAADRSRHRRRSPAFAPTLTMVTGDLTLNGLPREFRAAQAWLETAAAAAPSPGNHDTPYWNLLLRSLTPFGRYRTYVGAAADGRARR